MSDERKPIPIEQFGRDYWSTFAYVETRCVDHQGIPHKPNMRANLKRHPEHTHHIPFEKENETFPTRLRDGREINDHDDWDCVDDLSAAGLVLIKCTGAQPVWALTGKGLAAAAALRSHIASGGQIPGFAWEEGAARSKRRTAIRP